MVKLFDSLCVAFCLLIVSASANAVLMDDVGVEDRLIASYDSPNSGDATISAWVASQLGVDSVDLTFKEDSPSESGWLQIDDASELHAYDLTTIAGYEASDFFIIKLGVGRSDADDTYLFENLGSLDWAAVNFTDMLVGQNLRFNFGRISHVTGFESASVPEPGTLFLLMVGVAGLVASRVLRLK